MAKIRPGYYLGRGKNLADLTNKEAARNSLGLGSAAMQPDARYVKRDSNLSDLSDVLNARFNLGVTYSSTEQALAGNNSTSVMSPKRVAEFAAQFGIGNTATLKSVGDLNNITTPSGIYYVLATTANKPSSDSGMVIVINNGEGVDGQLLLSQNGGRMYYRAALYGTWSAWETVTNHDDLPSSLAVDGYQKIPGGLILQWVSATSSTDGNQVFALPITFPNAGLVAGGMGVKGKLVALGKNSLTFNRDDDQVGTYRFDFIAVGY